MNKEILVVETIRAISEKKEELRQALIQLAPLVRKSSDCLQYDLFDPVEESDAFLILMRWKSMDGWQRHGTAPYIQEFVKKYDRILYQEAKEFGWRKIEMKN